MKLTRTTTFIGSEATVNNMNKRVWHKKSEYLLGQMPTDHESAS